MAKTGEIQVHIGISLSVLNRYLNEITSILYWHGTSKTDPTGTTSLIKM